MASADLATLGIVVETNGLAKGERALNNFASTGAKTEKKLNNSMASASRSMGMAGIQFQQFIGQIQGGQSPMVALSQQSADLGFVLGVPLLGAVTGIAASLGGMLIPSLFNSKSATEELTAAQESLSEIISTNDENVSSFTDKMKTLAKTNEALARIQISAGIFSANDAMAAATKQIKEASSEFEGWSDKTQDISDGLYKVSVIAEKTGRTQVGVIEHIGDTYAGTVAGIGGVSNYIENMSKDLGVSTKDALALANAFNGFTGTDSNIRNLSLTLDEVSNSTGKSNAKFSSFAKNISDSLVAISSGRDKTKLLKDALADFGIVTDTTAEKIKAISAAFTEKTAVLDADRIQMALNVALQKAGVKAGTDEANQLETVIRAYFKKADAIEAETAATRKREKATEDAIKATEKEALAYELWLESVNDAANPTDLLTEKINRIKTALAAGDLDESEGILNYLTLLENKIISLNQKTAVNPFADWMTDAASKTGDGEDTSLQDMIDSLTSGTKIAQLNSLQEKIYLIKDYMSADLIPEDIGTEAINNAISAMEELRDVTSEITFATATDEINNGLSSLKTMAGEGTSAYKSLSVASDAYAAFQAINAVLNQAGGDPYTAFARMAAMAATVMSLGQSIGSLGDVSGDDSAEKQATQGTDTWGNDYTSIADATESTADATEDLVGINTDMLDALTSLQSGISGAAAISARGIADVDYNNEFDTSNFLTKAHDFSTKMTKIVVDPFNLLGGVLDSSFGWIGKALGGSSKVKDEGIKILGGTLEDLINDASVYAYQKVKSKKGFWDHSKTKTYTSYLDDASDQFSLVFSSLYDSVFAAGEVLGLSSDYLNDMLGSFVINDISISLKGLDADASADEIEAVFSEVFNGLAEYAVPFISDFQDAGEELGSTLVRLATEVSLLDYASNALGFSLGNLTNDSYNLTSAADALASYFGDTESFSDNVSSFLNNFADDSVLIDLYAGAMTDSLSAVGLSLPRSSEAMWNLMSSLDASTDSELEQIATLLELSDTSKEYYDLLEDAQSDMAELSDTFAGAVASIYDVSDATTQMSLDSALAAARLGDFSLAEALNVSDYTLATSDFSSLSDYNIAQAEAANKLMEIAELSAKEAGDVEIQQLDELRAINSSIIESIRETNALLSANNRIAVDSNDYLDTINNKTSYAA